MTNETAKRKDELKALLVEFAEEHFSSDHSIQVVKQHIEDCRVSALDEQLAHLTSDQEIQGFLGGINALAPSPGAKKVAEDLAKNVLQLGAVLEAMYRLPPKEMEAFVQAPFLPLRNAEKEPDGLLRYQDEVESWEHMKRRVSRDLALLERIASRVLLRSTFQKQPRTRSDVRKPSRKGEERAVINPKNIQACCRVHFAILDVLMPLGLSFQDVTLRMLTTDVWNLYRKEEKDEVDQDAFKAALASKNFSQSQIAR